MAWHQAIIWSNDGLIQWRNYASLGLNQLNDKRDAEFFKSVQHSPQYNETCL